MKSANPGVRTTSRRSRLMKHVRQKDTPLEARVRRALFAHGGRYRVNVKGLPGSPDIANKGRRKAVFVHGCFWHHHKRCARGRVPKRNREFWAEKLAANEARDARKVEDLESLGYDVLIVWECEVDDENLGSRLKEFWLA